RIFLPKIKSQGGSVILLLQPMCQATTENMQESTSTEYRGAGNFSGMIVALIRNSKSAIRNHSTIGHFCSSTIQPRFVLIGLSGARRVEHNRSIGAHLSNR